jgi:hypothetical protein
MSETMHVFKFTLPTGKVIMLREPKIMDLEVSAQIAGKTAGDNKALLGLILQKEQLKRLLVEIDGKKPTMTEKEQLDNLLTFKEYSFALKAVQMVTGDDEDEGKLTMEFIAFGGK